MTDLMNQVSRHDRGAATNKETAVKVTARPLAAAPWVGFTMVADYKHKGGKQDGDKLMFDARAGQFDLSFELDDQTKLKLDFYSDFADAMWIEVGEQCPSGPGNSNGAITAGRKAGPNKLVMTNTNDVEQTLTFMLRFTGNSSGTAFPPYEYDPKIVNGGEGLH